MGLSKVYMVINYRMGPSEEGSYGEYDGQPEVEVAFENLDIPVLTESAL